MQKTLPNILRDSRWILPAGLGLGAILPLFQNGDWLIGWLASSVILLVGLLVLTASWRWAGKGRTLAWMIALALLLRLASAVALQVFLPINGYDNEQQHAGYVFFDAYRRDGQAWELSQSETPTWTAFSKQFYTDQYGGLLALSAGTYRYLSPDTHRPLLVVLLAALTAALGVPFFWKSAHSLGGDKLAVPASWIFALYPESILQGSSQMREPFLITFVAMAFWGLLDWQANNNRKAWLWLGAGLAGMLLFSPAIALITLLILGGWLWFSKEHQRVSWRMILTVSVVFLVGLFLLSWS
ncbi:MAG: hypothetical protein GXP40_07900, partial [Chloroflexi bacterium]|nr:hypothetical protein [Chloroflexota bacterium]